MAQLRINANPTFTIDVTVRESDEYSESVYVKFDRHVLPEEIRGCSEMFLTPTQVEQLGRFLIRQADEIRTAQDIRNSVA
jgi:hypothetical protein